MKVLVKASSSDYKVTFKRDNDYDGYEGWHILVNGHVVGKAFRESESRTRVDAIINGKNVYGNGFNNMSTAKMYIKSFISDYM